MDWKDIVRRLVRPPLWLTCLLITASAAALPAVFINGWDTQFFAYGIYVLAFYTLVTACIRLLPALPGQYRRLRRRIMDHSIGKRYMTDGVFRAKASLYRTLSMNLLYVAIHLLSWYLYRSWWFVCLAVYYGILSVMRYVLARYVHRHDIGSNRLAELKRAFACSCIMLLLNLFLSGAVLMMVYQKRGFEYHGVLIYVMALYTFYTAIHAVGSFVKYRRFESPVISTAKTVSVASALVSMLSLETAMFAEFGEEMAKKNQQLMIMLTGAGISLVVIAMALYTILRCTKEIKEIKKHGEF